MQDPIDVLLQEHGIIMERIADLRRVVRDPETRGGDVADEALSVFRSVGEMTATTLHLHARKEDEALFPALEAVFGSEMGPTAVMRQEHQAIHAQAEFFRRALHAKDGGAAELKEAGSEIIRLLDAHFGKEEMILFPMARNLLPPEALRRVMERMEEIEADIRR